MFALFLNPMTGNCENSVCVAIAESSAMLENLLIVECCEPYSDSGPDFFNYDGGTKNYTKCFNKGGILEMYNPPERSFCEPCGIIEIDSIDDIQTHYNDMMLQHMSNWNSTFGQALRL